MTQRPPRCQLAFNSSLAVGKTSLVVTCLGLIRNRRAGANVLRVKKARGERASIQSAASWRTLLVIQMRDRQSGRRLTIERRTNVSPRMLRSPAIRRRGLRDADSQRRRSVTAPAGRLSGCHFATEHMVYEPSGWRTISVLLRAHSIPASPLRCMCSLT